MEKVFNCPLCVIYSRGKAYSNNTDGYSNNCPFCGKLENDVLVVKEHWFVTKNKYSYPRTEEHILVIPHRHIEKYDEIEKKEWEELLGIISFYASMGYIRLGREYPHGGSSVKHLHIHLIKNK